MRAILSAIVLMGCASGLLAPAETLRDADAIVVLGNRPPLDTEGNIRPELRRRVERGVALFHEGRAPQLVMTGGQVPGGAVEAEVMRALAVELGVPRAHIQIEARSRDTIENAGFTLRLLCGGDRECMPKLIVVSSPFHLQRARELFECAGARVQLASTEFPAHDLAYRRRWAFYERVVRLYYGFIDECARVRAARNAH